MPCLPVPVIPDPQLPSPLTLGAPSLPSINTIVPTGALLPCCSISVPAPDLPYPLNAQPSLPPIIAAVPGIEAILNAAVGEVNTFLQSLSPSCPLE
jgi:hypothetical protein